MQKVSCWPGRLNKELSNIFSSLVVVWSQEEHRNMGAWTFVKPRFENMCGRKVVWNVHLLSIVWYDR